MARVGVASASLRSRRVRGLAKTLACPAYGRLLGMEPLMHKAVPVLILVFLSTVVVASSLQILEARDRAIAAATANLEMTVALASAQLPGISADKVQAVLDRLPAPAPGAVFAAVAPDSS